MNPTVWFVASEASPLAKTGGLADVCGALPRALIELGVDCRLLLPWYSWIEGTPVTSFQVPFGGYKRKVTLGRTTIGSLPVDLIGHPPYFERPNLYTESGTDYGDNDRRFILFSRAALERSTLTDPPDLYHCHDWFTGLLPTYLRCTDAYPPRPCLFTIHNLKHQGVFPASAFDVTGLPGDCFRPEGIEFYGQVNMLKAGVVYADHITTVSPTYSREIQTAEYGENLEGVLQKRGADLSGILNGIDTDEWNPATDRHLKPDERYDSEDLAGKGVVKRRLCSEFDLHPDGREPLIGMIGRIVPQKGFGLVLRAWEALMGLPGRWILLGTGDSELESRLRGLEERTPARLKLLLTFNEALAHRIEAAADIFCMPSRFEPCGLNQMYSMRYGTVPVVSKTGGLADSVDDPRETGSPDRATGFCFESWRPEALRGAVERAVTLYRDDPEAWRRMQRAGMEQDWSWTASAQQYRTLYRELTA